MYDSICHLYCHMYDSILPLLNLHIYKLFSNVIVIGGQSLHDWTQSNSLEIVHGSDHVLKQVLNTPFMVLSHKLCECWTLFNNVRDCM